ncbi:hypothetical protein KBD45_04795 [Candidatus Dojkabacteria bacterium]|nr:hypothetical protein [Candidatus Dojkabacteria bacterium]
MVSENIQKEIIKAIAYKATIGKEFLSNGEIWSYISYFTGDFTYIGFGIVSPDELYGTSTKNITKLFKFENNYMYDIDRIIEKVCEPYEANLKELDFYVSMVDYQLQDLYEIYLLHKLMNYFDKSIFLSAQGYCRKVGNFITRRDVYLSDSEIDDFVYKAKDRLDQITAFTRYFNLINRYSKQLEEDLELKTIFKNSEYGTKDDNKEQSRLIVLQDNISEVKLIKTLFQVYSEVCEKLNEKMNKK